MRISFDVHTLDGSDAGTIGLDGQIFDLEPRPDLLQRMVRWQLAKRRAGTHAVQNRSDVNRTRKKAYKQKGTGNARHGAASAPQFRGGGRAFGPVPRDHSHDLPKKVRALALRHALSAKAKASTLIIVDDIKIDDHKTKGLVERFGKMGLSDALIIGGAEVDVNFGRAARAIPQIDVLPVQGINVYDILRHDTLVLTKAAVEALESRFGGGGFPLPGNPGSEKKGHGGKGNRNSNESVSSKSYSQKGGRTTPGAHVDVRSSRSGAASSEWLFRREDPDWEDERRLMDAFQALCEKEERARVIGVRTLVGEGLRHLANGGTGRRTSRRLRAIMPALHRALFDRSASVQREAAFAICTLRDPKSYAPGGTQVERPDPERLLRDIEDYLKALKTRLLTSVEVVRSRSVQGRLVLDVRIRVLDHLPVDIDGLYPRLQRPDWLSDRPTIEAHLFTTDREIAIDEFKSEADRDTVAALSFSADTGADPAWEMYVDVKLDGRSLERHLIDLREARAEAAVAAS